MLASFPNHRKNIKKWFTSLLISGCVSLSWAQDTVIVDKVHFLIPAGAGGGWDGTARGVGEALSQAKLVKTASYENMSGGGGGKGIGYLIENRENLKDTLMISSTPIIIRSLTGVFPQNYRDLTPIASVIGDYAVLVVKADSPIQDTAGLIKYYQANKDSFAFAGGSVPGGMDHLVGAMVFQAGGIDPLSVTYLPFDAGGKAMASLLSGEAVVMSTGLSEVLGMAESGKIRIIGYTAAQPVESVKNAKTFKAQGFDVEFINWRGLFAAPGISADQQQAWINLLEKMLQTPEWEVVRQRNGWVNVFHKGQDFSQFLENQEAEMAKLMKKMGFL